MSLTGMVDDQGDSLDKYVQKYLLCIQNKENGRNSRKGTTISQVSCGMLVHCFYGMPNVNIFLTCY